MLSRWTARSRKIDDFLDLLTHGNFGALDGGQEQRLGQCIGLAMDVGADQQVLQDGGILEQFDVLEGSGNAKRRHIMCGATPVISLPSSQIWPLPLGHKSG